MKPRRYPPIAFIGFLSILVLPIAGCGGGGGGNAPAVKTSPSQPETVPDGVARRKEPDDEPPIIIPIIRSRDHNSVITARSQGPVPFLELQPAGPISSYGVATVKALDVHAAGWRGTNVTVAVIDGEMDTEHPDLKGAFHRHNTGYAKGYNFAEGHIDVRPVTHRIENPMQAIGEDPADAREKMVAAQQNYQADFSKGISHATHVGGIMRCCMRALACLYSGMCGNRRHIAQQRSALPPG